jgi:alpha-L-fucosidase
MKRILLLSALLCVAFSIQMHAQTNGKEHIPLKHGAHRTGRRTDADMQRWREYGLGQFIHWGVYAIPGGVWNGKTYTGAAEWIRSWKEMPNDAYDNLYKQFNPANFDAKRWAVQAKEMGVRYMIFTTKHHDGFCMWPSKYTDYTIAATPYKKDIVKELVDAYASEGIDVYLYFSIIDWSHPGYTPGDHANPAQVRRALAAGESYHPFKSKEQEEKYETFKTFTRNQLLELLDNYPGIKGLWFDGSWDISWICNAAWADSLGFELREKHPGLIIGSRFRADELGYRHVDANGDLIDDYDQRFERNLPNNLEETKGFDWDCVMTIPENQWGYHRDWSWTYVKTPYELIEMAVEANSLDGNFVINFGPDGNGNIRKEECEIAKEIGIWMAKNGDALYGAHHSILEKQDWGYSTQNGDHIYLSVFNKPINNMIRVKLPKSNKKDMIYIITKAEILSTKETVRINGKEKTGARYRDKSGSSYNDLIIPESLRNPSAPFVIVIKVKEIEIGDLESYQQALT